MVERHLLDMPVENSNVTVSCACPIERVRLQNNLSTHLLAASGSWTVDPLESETGADRRQSGTAAVALEEAVITLYVS